MTADQIRPNKDAVVIKEDETVSLSCSYDTSNYLYWYRQYPGSAPEFLELILDGTTSTKKKFPLKIKDVRVSDSAVYYCALRPTVTETHSALIQKLLWPT
uniref:Ig-like domain-containing protein n=1 Tax=Cyprinus carpio TaxID=7962 RepID=A0A8C1VQU7_CYPCA